MRLRSVPGRIEDSVYADARFPCLHSSSISDEDEDNTTADESDFGPKKQTERSCEKTAL